MTIKYAPSFFNKFKKVDVRVRKSVKERMLIFSKNPMDTELNNHPLRKEYKGYRSIDINSDYRALYQEKQEGAIAYFTLLGTHDELYL